MHNIFRGIGAYSPCRFLVNCATWCVLEHIFRELSLNKIYINLNNIDMLLLRASYSYGVFLEYILNFKFVRLGVYMVKLCHEKMRILRSILPPQKKIEPPPENNLTSHPWKISNTLTRNSTHWE